MITESFAFKRNPLLLALGLILLVSLACSIPFAQRAKPTALPEIVQPTPTALILETLPPPLANMDFPEDQKPYPADWPVDLHFPEILIPVDFSQGILPGGDKLGRILKLRFNGTLQDAETGLRSFLSEKGWQIVEEADLDGGGNFWIIDRNGSGTGMLVIDIQEPGRIIILGTFYV